jgi:hypothetical protein
MNKLLIFFSLLLCLKASAQPDIKHSIYFKDKKCLYDADPPPNLDFKHYYWNIEAHSSGNFYAIRPIVVGSGANTQFDVILCKLNAQFDTLWTKQIGGSEDDWIYSIKEIAGGNMVLSGITSSNDGDVSYGHNYASQELWVIKIDTSGNILNGKTYGGSAGTTWRSCILSSDNYLYLSGETNSDDYDFTHVNYGPFDLDVWITKIDTNLNLKWVRLFSGNSDEGGMSIEEVTPNKLVLCIVTAGTNSEMLGNQAKGISDMLIYCIDSTKNTVWAKRLGCSGVNDAFKSLVDPVKKDIYIVGGSQYGDLDVQYQTADSNLNTWIVKLDTLGNLLQSKAYGNKQQGYYVAEMNLIDAVWHNGHVWVAAYSIGGGGDMDPRVGTTDNNNAWIGMIDTQANLVGKYTIGTTGNDTPYDLFSDGNELYLHGVSGAPINPMSCTGKIISTYILTLGTAPLGVTSYESNKQMTVYPNPNLGILNISLNDFSNHEKVRYKIVNLEGRTCLAGQFKKTEHDYQLDIQSLMPGKYTIQLTINNQTYSSFFLKQ